MRIAADTNVLVRYLTWDDEPQAAEAAATIEAADAIFVATIVLCELAWVLKRAYRYRIADIAEALRGLVSTRNIELDRAAAEAGLAFLDRGGDFADGVVQYEAGRAKCHRLVTFDRELARLLNPAEVTLLGRA